MSNGPPDQRLASPSGRRSSIGGEPAEARGKRAASSSNGAPAASRKGTQRQRLIDAMIELSAQSGYQHVSIAQLYSRAGVSPVSFYEQFADKEDCLVAAYRESGERTLGQIGQVPEGIDWSAAAQLALGRLLMAVQSDPQAGRVLFIRGLAPGGANPPDEGRPLPASGRPPGGRLRRPSQPAAPLAPPH